MDLAAIGSIRRRRLLHLSQLRERIIILTDSNFRIISTQSLDRPICLSYRPAMTSGCHLLRDCVRLSDQTAVETLLLCGKKRNLFVSLPVSRPAEAVEVSMLRLFHDEKLPIIQAIECANEIAATLREMSPMLQTRMDHSLGVILSGCNRLLGMINSMLDGAAGALGARIVQYQCVDMVHHVRTICIGMMPMAMKAEIGLTYRSNVPSLDATLDPEFVTRIVENLLSNAIWHTPSGGRIWVRVDLLDGARLQLSVTDNGPGIPEDIKDRVFERFVTGRSAPHASAGVGLGLYNVRVLTEKMGGEVCCVSTTGQGARFDVILPVSTAGEPEGGAPTDTDAMQKNPQGHLL